MKTAILFLATLIVPGYVFPQFTTGVNGLTIKRNAVVSVNGLTITPSLDLTISRNDLVKSTVPVQGSIARVYRFKSSIAFSGVTRIAYLESELNGLSENNLQIAHSSDAITYTLAAGSTMSTSGNFVYNTIANPALQAVTIMRSNAARTEPKTNRQKAFEIATAGEDEISEASAEFLVMGNPVQHDDARFCYRARQSGRATIRLSDINGRILLIRNENIVPGINMFSLPVRGLRSGLYFVELSHQRERKVLKLVKE